MPLAQKPSGAFIRFPACHRELPSVLPEFGKPAFPANTTLLGFSVAGTGLGSRAAACGNRENFYFPDLLLAHEPDTIADAYPRCRLARFAVDAYVAALNGLACRSARLVETREPEPSIQSQRIIRHSILHHGTDIL
jgi:hypothetical protein